MPATPQPLDAPPPPLTLTVRNGPLEGKLIELHDHGTFLVGRGPGVNLVIEGDPHMSRRHFCIEYNPPLASVIDMRSRAGTFLNDERIEQSRLRDGDRIRAGLLVFEVRFPGGEGTVPLPAGESEWPMTISTPNTLTIPGFAVEEEVGKGGMGVVYRARRLADGQIFAIKTILPAVAPGLTALARFQREAEVLQKLQHPNIVRFHETGEVGGQLYFVMEFVEGRCASGLVREAGPLPLARVTDLGCQLLDALDHAHRMGFVHRDVKPGNLLLAVVEGREVLKLADFGLAKTYQASALSGLTISGMSGGTPEFMPPEQVSDFRSARPASDLYAVAASLYHLLTGQHVYERSRNHTELLLRILQDEPIPLRDPYPGPALPEPLGTVIRRGLARDPALRYPDAKSMREALTAGR
jgi:serine/threonine-protein kinase